MAELESAGGAGKMAESALAEGEAKLAEGDFAAARGAAERAMGIFAGIAAVGPEKAAEKVAGLLDRVDAAEKKASERERGGVRLALAHAALGARKLDEADSELAEAVAAYEAAGASDMRGVLEEVRFRPPTNVAFPNRDAVPNECFLCFLCDCMRMKRVCSDCCRCAAREADPRGEGKGE